MAHCSSHPISQLIHRAGGEQNYHKNLFLDSRNKAAGNVLNYTFFCYQNSTASAEFIVQINIYLIKEFSLDFSIIIASSKYLLDVWTFFFLVNTFFDVFFFIILESKSNSHSLIIYMPHNSINLNTFYELFSTRSNGSTFHQQLTTKLFFSDFSSHARIIRAVDLRSQQQMNREGNKLYTKENQTSSCSILRSACEKSSSTWERTKGNERKATCWAFPIKTIVLAT